MTTVQILQLAIATYFLVIGSMMTTKNFVSALVFKVVPLASAFVLGLIAFKVIA